MGTLPERPLHVDSIHQVKGHDGVVVDPTFVLLFSVQMNGTFSGFRSSMQNITPLGPEHLQGYAARFSELERHVFGEDFAAAGRTKRWPLGRIVIPNEGREVGFPSHADVYLVAHTTGTAIWEAWLRGPSQTLDALRLDRMA